MIDKKNIREKIQNLTDIELKILHEAKDHFEKSGYYGTNLEVIADKINIGKATIYRHFGNKSDLFFYALVLSLHESFSKFAEIEKIEDPYEALDFCITLFFEAMERIHMHKLKNSLMAQAMTIDNVGENIVEYFKEMRIRIVCEVEKLISLCLKKSELETDGARSISEYIVTTLSLYMHIKASYEEENEESCTGDMEDIKKFIFRGIGMSSDDILRTINNDKIIVGDSCE